MNMYVENPTAYKVIYVFAIDDLQHQGVLKIGDATLATDQDPNEVRPNCDLLNEAANDRIRSYTNTVGATYRLVYTELALKKDGQGRYRKEGFRDHQVHAVLARSGIAKVQMGDTHAQEWYRCTEGQAKAAIRAVQEGRTSLTGTEKGVHNTIYTLRVEQEDAVQKTLARFKTANAFLWNCKMRFGKTISALTVVKRGKFRRTIIVTHRPVVQDGWNTDFWHVFEEDSGYQFIDRSELTENEAEKAPDVLEDQKNDIKLRNLDATGAHFVYFASMQDLRGSKVVGGKFDKNQAVFDLEWDLVIIDEAHEGTTTELGKRVEENLRHKKTKLLALSGTPFNILDQYEGSVYTWDYINEQRAKEEWDMTHPLEPNPYGDLPQMHIYTFDLNRQIHGYEMTDIKGKFFNFREFFRVWTGDPEIDRRSMPAGAKVGTFVHEKDVESFLNLITRPNEETFYPYASDEYRDMFRHTLWMVPGVKEAAALSELLHRHEVFQFFGIANVAGDGDAEQPYDNALKLVRDTIHDNLDGHTITISCGKLTTGVTVKEWTAVMMLSGSASTAAAGYMQTIFRVQSAGMINGRQKEHCYVFDFAPDRTLIVLADAMDHTERARRDTYDGDTESAMRDLLNYCPVIAFDGTRMKPFSVTGMMAQMKKIFVQRAICSGFEDNSIYDQKRLLQLTDLDTNRFAELHRIIGASKANGPQRVIEMNKTGLTEAELEKIEKKPGSKKPKVELSEEEKELQRKLKEAREQRKNAISILRGVSIRMPMLIYGADVPFNEDITLEQFVELVDEESWAEFMPQGVTKKIFRDFMEYYDKSVFISAGREIRRLAKEADDLPPSKRIKSIARIFSYFKNPDKETVLTPWRVVNMHMGDTLGGYSFFDEGYNQEADEPHSLKNGSVTDEVFDRKSRVLEINSKSGLYPLYVAYSIFRDRLSGLQEDDYDPNTLKKHWAMTLKENVFVICKTPMAKLITTRTLAGYTGTKVNTYCYKKLLDTLQAHPEQFIRTARSLKTWGLEGKGAMKFNAVVGNPPYQAELGGASPLPIYHHFIIQAKALEPNYVSMISPARWFSTGNGLDAFRDEMLHDEQIAVLCDYPDATACFSNVEIKGGVAYFLWQKGHHGPCMVTTHNVDGTVVQSVRNLVEPGLDTFVRNPVYLPIIHKVRSKGEPSFSSLISSRDPFGFDIRLPGSMKVAKHEYSLEKSEENDVAFYYNKWRKEGVGYVPMSKVIEGIDMVDKYKVLAPKAWGTGNEKKDWLNPFIVKPHSVCTETYLVLGAYDDRETCENLVSYVQTKFFHALTSVLKISQNAAKGVYDLVPIQDFTRPWTDADLYAKYGLTDEEISFIERTIKPMA